MGHISQDTLKIIKEAIQLEINGRNFFEYAAEQTQNTLGEKMFNKLASDEIEHLKVFGKLFSQIIGSDDWKKFVSEEQKKVSPIIEELKKRLHHSERSSEIEAIRIGMELERKAIDFFDKSAQETTDDHTAAICKKISEEERWHFDLLQSQLDSVSNTGFWMDVADFKMDGQY